MINHSIDKPQQYVSSKERHLGRNIAIGFGSVALAAIIAHGAQSDPEFDIKSKAQLATPISVEHLPEINQEQTGPVIFNEIGQDEIPGRVVELSTLEFAEQYGIQLQNGQSDIDYLSAKSIEDAVKQVTGGSVQPGTTFETRLNAETGFIVSTYTSETSE